MPRWMRASTMHVIWWPRPEPYYAGYPNISYHLAALALEETGRRELIAIQVISAAQLIPPAWPLKHTQDHVQKIFWSLFGGRFYQGRLIGGEVEQMRSLARNIHFKRLAGLYVDQADGAINIPSETIYANETKILIDFANARINLAASYTLRAELPPDVLALQAWFMRATDNRETRHQILSHTRWTSFPSSARCKHGCVG